MTEAESLQQFDRTFVIHRKRKLSYFSGCDYFRLSSHPEVLTAFRSGEARYGLNVAASRMTTGNHALFVALEEELAKFFGVPKALLVTSGYVGSTVVAQALAGSFSHVLLDDRSHPALVDAARFFECPVLRFRSRDPDSLSSTVKRCGRGAKLLVLTDGLFSHDGSIAPLHLYLRVLPGDAKILVDDAHGAGVLGKTGKGTPEQTSVSRERIIQTITLSKALGTFGGAILCDAPLRNRILSHSHAFAGATPIPLPIAAASLASLSILRRDGIGLRCSLHENTSLVRMQLREAGLEAADNPGPIIPFTPTNSKQAGALKRALMRNGIYPPFIKYPTAPAEGYFRFVISSEHTRRQLQRVADTLVQTVCPENGRSGPLNRTARAGEKGLL